MTYTELVIEIQRLPLAERLQLLDLLTRSIHGELGAPKSMPVPVEQILGLLQPDGPPPSDNDISDSYTDYLTKKYA